MLYFDIPGPGKQNFLHKYKEIVVRRDLSRSVTGAPARRSRAVRDPGLGAGIPPLAAGRCPLPTAPLTQPAPPTCSCPPQVVVPKSS